MKSRTMYVITCLNNSQMSCILRYKLRAIDKNIQGVAKVFNDLLSNNSDTANDRK